RRRHTRWPRDWSSDVCSSDLEPGARAKPGPAQAGRSVHSKAYFDEGIVRHSSKAAPLQNERFDPAAADFDEGIVRHAEPVEMDEIGRASCRERGQDTVVGGTR